MNRLAAESSPYLRQHADNPVDWRPWGDDAFAEARARDVPVFLSIGYSSCHWCHVMAHESFEDPDIAAMMNARFVNVKVDREERPDVDSIYMEATQAMTGRGGWPMSVWLTADGRPFHCGTYFPPDDRQGMPSFRRVCDAITQAWTERRDEVLDAAGRLTDVIGQGLPVASGPVTEAVLREARERLVADTDLEWGGFGRAPKFPQAAALTFLARRQAVAPEADGLAALTVTLDAMAAGGMYDQIGGGFARYSVDDYWLVPHFEKMLYDNAQLLRAYTAGWLVTHEPRYARIVAETLAFAERELLQAAGGVASALDADSEGVEGKFYLWSLAEVREVCAAEGIDVDEVIRYYGITEAGNFVDPHTQFRGNVLHAVDRHEDPSATIDRARAALLARRATRVRPGLDDKVLLAWNALLVRGLAEAAWVFDRADWLERARSIARFCLTHLRRDDGRLLRSWSAVTEPRPGWGADGRGRHLGYAEDYAALLEALVTLAEVDTISWLDDADSVARALLDHFADSADGGFFTTGDDAEALLVRPKDQMDNATPSASSLAANGLLRLAAITDDDEARRIATTTVERVAPFLTRAPVAFAYLLEAAERLVGPAREIAIVGATDDPRTRALQRAVASRLLPATVVVSAPDGDDAIALLAGRAPVDGAPAAYVCEHFVCARPVTDPDALAPLLAP
jgi:uncharacterized protein YyaL (SSP411 family)